MLPAMATLDPTRFRALSFDCYGTLIDWERGLLTALHEVFEARAIHADPDELLEAYAVIEPRVEHQAFRPYRQVLELVLDELCEEFGFPVSPEECAAFAASVPAWPAFPDSAAALARLAERGAPAGISIIVENHGGYSSDGSWLANVMAADSSMSAMPAMSYGLTSSASSR